MICAEHKACKNFERWVDSEMPLIDCCVQEINRHVCDWLLLNAAKHVEIESDVQSANHNALDSLPNLQWNAIITALTEGAIDFVWGCLAPSSTPIEPGLMGEYHKYMFFIPICSNNKRKIPQ